VSIINANKFHINSVQIFGADQDITQSLNEVAEHTLTGSYLWMFSRQSTLVYPKGALISAISTASPRIQEVAVRRDGWNTLIVTVTQKVPEAVVCVTLPDWNGDTLNTESSEGCYFADQTGYIFKEAPAFSGHVYNRYYAPDTLDTSSSSTDAVGHIATSTEEFARLQHVYAIIRSAGIDLQAILIKQGGEYELYVGQKGATTSTSNQSDTFVIYANTLRPLETQVSNLISFWNKMNTDSTLKKAVAQRFEYIDIRYGSNVFYRLIK
jgi:hypothetical protein